MLKLFNKTRRKNGMVGLYATPESLTLAYVEHTNGAPNLVCCEEVSASGADDRAKALGKLVKKYKLENSKTSFVLSPNDTSCFLLRLPVWKLKRWLVQ